MHNNKKPDAKVAGEPRDYYTALGVARNAAPEDIKDAFRRLALRYHPDRCKEPDAEERFKEIGEAYAVLSDADRRREYNLRGHAAVGGFSPEDLYASINFSDIFGGSGKQEGPRRHDLRTIRKLMRST